MPEPSMVILGGRDPRRPGRPRAKEPRTSVSAWIPASEHDRLIELAKAKEMSLSAFVRKVLRDKVCRRR
jgi:predicted HicB family RNase H-like nuclease